MQTVTPRLLVLLLVFGFIYGPTQLRAEPQPADVEAPANHTPALAERAAPSGEECIAWFSSAQVKRAQGQLLAAAQELGQCLHPACGPRLGAECGKLLDTVEAETPSIVLAAKSSDSDLEKVTVFINGETVAHQLDGLPLKLDPGRYELRFVAPGWQPIQKLILLKTGERNRIVTATMQSLHRSERAPASNATPVPNAPAAHGAALDTLDYVVVGTGVGLGLAAAGFGVATYLAHKSAVEDCKPYCSPGRREQVRNRARLADSLAVLSGAVLAYGALRILLSDPASPTATTLRIGPLQLTAEGQF